MDHLLDICTSICYFTVNRYGFYTTILDFLQVVAKTSICLFLLVSHHCECNLFQVDINVNTNNREYIFSGKEFEILSGPCSRDKEDRFYETKALSNKRETHLMNTYPNFII